MEDKLYTHCLRCNRKLKTQETRARGYGDTCWKKVQYPNKKRLFDVADSGKKERQH